jgi:hypothetical protein
MNNNFTYISLILILISWGGMILRTLGTSVTIWPIVPALMIDGDECGAVVGLTIVKDSVDRSSRKKKLKHVGQMTKLRILFYVNS